MLPVDYQTTICTGDTVAYSMGVYGESDILRRHSIFGAEVEAYPQDKTLGTFDKATQTVRFREGRPEAARFRFKAGKKAGTTTLVFQGTVSTTAGKDQNYGYVSYNIPIRIIDCRFRVSGTLRYPPDTNFAFVPAPPLVVRIKPTMLTADADGHLSALASVHWVSASVTRAVPGGTCTLIETFLHDDEVAINGEVSDEGVLTLTFEFPTADGLLSIACDGVTIQSQHLLYLVNTLTVHIRTSGGTIRSVANFKDLNTLGTAAIIVKNVKK